MFAEAAAMIHDSDDCLHIPTVLGLVSGPLHFILLITVTLISLVFK